MHHIAQNYTLSSKDFLGRHYGPYSGANMGTGCALCEESMKICSGDFWYADSKDCGNQDATPTVLPKRNSKWLPGKALISITVLLVVRLH